MIALETNAKLGNSLKKPQVEIENDDIGEDGDDDITDAESISDAVDHNTSKLKANPGWADVMQKILKTKKPKRKKTLVLSKAKKLCDVVKKEEENLSFEVDGKDEKSETVPNTDVSQEVEEKPKLKRKDTSLSIRIKPSIADRERERMLQKIATKGVVQLFNAVKEQRIHIDRKLAEAGPLERKREKVFQNIDKRTFLDVLMGGSKSIPVDSTVERTENDSNEKTNRVWKVLREDFVMGAKLKDWDKKGETEEEDSSAPEELDSDD